MNPECFFGNTSLWVRSRAAICVIFEADYKIKLLVITSGKNGQNTAILKFQKRFIWLLFFNNWRKRTSHNFSKLLNECMEKPYRAHLPSSSRTHVCIPGNNRRSLSWENRRHTSRIAFGNSAIFEHFCELRWFTLWPIKSQTYSIKFISADTVGHWSTINFTNINKTNNYLSS